MQRSPSKSPTVTTVAGSAPGWSNSSPGSPSRSGITHFTATVLAENRAVLGLMQHSGWEIATTLDGPYADVVVTLPPRLMDHRPDVHARRVELASVAALIWAGRRVAK